ncbi:hypothetical protein TNCV_1966641 [Trichonephila clavipes]|nr:hypothetical protein TNCV_1966641 [Trichonephila clavipes]
MLAGGAKMQSLSSRGNPLSKSPHYAHWRSTKNRPLSSREAKKIQVEHEGSRFSKPISRNVTTAGNPMEGNALFRLPKFNYLLSTEMNLSVFIVP